ncbi:uncharacterized protein [Gossypium hirsutum]|uniref:Methyltransferase type 11 domain-containing protein n=1 Tax=Gossypium hirsutum TaxID=3635 RepID=A0ABM3AYI9_GOSHI|nr:uncharacterized protein LOC107910834 [Gossypium hirsutum]
MRVVDDYVLDFSLVLLLVEVVVAPAGVVVAPIWFSLPLCPSASAAPSHLCSLASSSLSVDRRQICNTCWFSLKSSSSFFLMKNLSVWLKPQIIAKYLRVFSLQTLTLLLLKNHSKVLCVSAGAGHEVMTLSKMGLKNVIGVELIESLPLVSRANPHNLPFFDRAFDVAFTGHLMAALYPLRNAKEMERTVRKGGVCVVVVDECGEEEVNEIFRLFRRSRLLSSCDFTLNGRRVARIIMRKKTSD